MVSLTHWGRVTHIRVSKLIIIGSDNGLSPDQRQAIIWTNAGILLIGPFGTNFSEIFIEILTFSFKKMRLKVLSAKRRSFCHGLNVSTVTLKRWRYNYFQSEYRVAENRWHVCYSRVNNNLAPICACKNIWRIWRHNCSTSRFAWRHGSSRWNYNAK